MKLDNGVRLCDVCEETIPPGVKYRKTTMLPEAASMRLTGDKELIPSWTTNADGMILMDICLTCTISMGSGEEQEPS